MFDPFFAPENQVEEQEQRKKSFKAFKYSLLIYLFMIIQTVVLFFYVDILHPVPQYYFDSIDITCGQYRKVYTFHFFSIVFEGYVTLIPSMYFFNWLKQTEFGKMILPSGSQTD